MLATELARSQWRETPSDREELASRRHGDVALEGDVGEGLLLCPDCDAEGRDRAFEEGEGGQKHVVARSHEDRAPAYTGCVGRTYKTEAVVLRSFRFAEADRVLHLYTAERGRVGAVAKGVRKTKSRFGARLEPFSHAELLLHQGSGELHTVTGVSLVDAHRPTREDSYRLAVGLVGAEAMLRLFVDEERNERAFEALSRFLSAVDAIPPGLDARAALDPLALAFQLKLLWLSGYVPHLEGCVECGATHELVGYLPRAGGAVCPACALPETVGLSPDAFRGIHALLRSPLADARDVGLGERAARDALAVVVASYEFHGGFRLRTLTA